MISEKTLKPFLNLLSNEQIGKVIREFIKPSEISLNEIESVLLSYLNEKRENYSKGALKGWKTKKEKQEKTQKGDLPKRELQKKYNNKGFNYDPYSQSNYNNIPQKHFDSLLNQRILESETVI